MCVFGGRYSMTKLKIPLSMSVFKKGFSVEDCVKAWVKVGIVPLMRAFVFQTSTCVVSSGTGMTTPTHRLLVCNRPTTMQ